MGVGEVGIAQCWKIGHGTRLGMELGRAELLFRDEEKGRYYVECEENDGDEK